MKKFKLLILGGDPVYGQHAAVGQSYVEQLARRLSREGQRLTVECHAPLTLAAMIELLPRLPLQQYDLIVLQPGRHELQRPEAFWAFFRLNVLGTPLVGHATEPGLRGRMWQRLCQTATLTALRLATGLTGLPRLQQTRLALRTVLDGLQPCGHNVVLLTPFPHQDPISNWLRQKGRRLFLEEGYRAFMPVFDAYSLLDVGDVCFLPGNGSQLNALGHELVGSALYDYFRAGVISVGDSSSYRRHE